MKRRPWVALGFVGLILGLFAWPSRTVPQTVPSLSSRVFAKPELGVSTATVGLLAVKDRLPNAAAWSDFLAR